MVGGMDQITPTLSLPPGVVRRAANFECSLNGGYTRIAGYERFDGQANPSDARYNVLSCTLTGAVAVGATVAGYSSAATGKVIAVSNGEIVITRETGTFLIGEGVTVSAASIGSIDAIAGAVADGLLDATYKSLAAAEYRASIAAVPGSGPVRGVAFYDGDTYAWRDNVGATMLGMYKSTTSGWTAVPYYNVFDFAVGTQEIFAGETIVGHLSGATALVKAVVLLTGAWANGDATGYIVFTNMTGTPTVNEWIYVGGTKHAEYRGAYEAIAPLPGGRVQAVTANFGGGQINKRLYFCDGVNRAYEFDGSTLVPLRTSMSPDVPSRISVHKQHLFLAFGHSLQFSAISDPYVWDPVLGAGEIAMNDIITQLLPLPGDQSSGAMAVYTKTDTSVLYGTSSEDFALSTFNVGTGGLSYTGQNLDQSYILSDRGVMGLGTTLNFGNFATASLTMNLRPFIQVRRNLASASIVNREKGQYRVFFSDGYGLYLTIANGKYVGAMPVQFPNPVLCTSEGQSVDGAETSFFGSSDGFVYLLDAGTSFDGAVIPANMSLVYNSAKSPRILKRYRKASVELTGDSYAEFSFGYDIGYRTQFLEQAGESVHQNDLRSAFWDSFSWDNFVFDGQELLPSEIEVTGTAENMAIRISSVSKLLKPFTVNSIIVHYTLRRGIR